MLIEDLLGVKKDEILDVVKNKSKYYYSYPIPKRDGSKRWLDAPTGKLKEWQNILLDDFLYHYHAHPIAYGFVPGRSPIDAAEKHVDKDVLVSLDIYQFFNNITMKDVFKTLSFLARNNERHSFKTILDHLPSFSLMSELLTYKGCTPQGAPTSPHIGNLCLLKFDKTIQDFAKEHKKVKVTRYADDITFSQKKETKDFVGKAINKTKKVLDFYGFSLNYDKIHVSRRHTRQQVLGIVVNEKVNIPRDVRRRFRAKLHNLKMSQDPVDELQEQKLRGKIEWIKSLNPRKGNQFLKELNSLNLIST